MGKLYIRGFVKSADRVRRDLSRPLSADRKEELRRFVAESLRQVDGILASHGTKLEGLPAPTRRAYQFLRDLDLDSVKPQPVNEPDSQVPGTVSLVGLKSFWDRILNQLAQPVPEKTAHTLHRSIRSTSENLERHLSNNGLRPGDLTTQSRAARGWLAFFSQRQNLDAYVAAVNRGTPILEGPLLSVQGFSPPLLLEFRPTADPCELRKSRDGTRAILETPMITFSETRFHWLATARSDREARQRLFEARLGDDYQNIQAEMEALCGVEERTAGVHHDLRASFDRANGRYFGGELARPRLTWSRTFTGRKFGHYDPIRDTVMISSTLDHADVPAFVVDFVMYHELLHKKLGVGWRNGRQAIHTPEFKAEERRFEQYAEAEAAIKQLARCTAQPRYGQR